MLFLSSFVNYLPCTRKNYILCSSAQENINSDTVIQKPTAQLLCFVQILSSVRILRCLVKYGVIEAFPLKNLVEIGQQLQKLQEGSILFRNFLPHRYYVNAFKHQKTEMKIDTLSASARAYFWQQIITSFLVDNSQVSLILSI